MENEVKSVFETLSAINVNDKKESKGKPGNKLDYLSWVWAWSELMKRYPDATSKVYENEQGWPYFTDGKTAWVKVSITINGIERIEYLPIMDTYNHSMKLDMITSFDVNKSLQRAVTKAIARWGLGLYIYAGEDLPEDDEETAQNGSNSNDSKKNKQVNVEAKKAQQNESVSDSARVSEIKQIIAGNDKGYGIDSIGRSCSKNYGASIDDITEEQYNEFKAKLQSIL